MNNVKCPAIGQRYRHFKQMDHFRICCRSRNTAVREILYDESNDLNDEADSEAPRVLRRAIYLQGAGEHWLLF